MYMSSNAIEVKVTGSVGTIVLNRPDRRNALTQAMLEQLLQALDDLYVEKRVRAITMTGKGSGFCAGMDAREIRDGYELPDAKERWGQDAALYRDLVVKMLEVPKPIIAAVNGPAVAGGTGLVLACDIVLASRESVFAPRYFVLLAI